MKLKEQVEVLRTLVRREHDALLNMVLGRVQWSGPKMITRIGGIPKRFERIGLVECSEPFIIVHEVDTHEVSVVTPTQAADWPWPTVAAFAGLPEFLSKYADLTVSVHTPSEAWVRRQRD